MGRRLAAGLAFMLVIATGLFWWQGRADGEGDSPPIQSAAAAAEELPGEGDVDAVGEAPPMPTEATSLSREQRRFARYDRDRDGIITRTEMMGSRAKAFRGLDKDGNNLLSFEEWAVATSDRFAQADGNKDGKVTPAEFAATAPKPKGKQDCRC